MKNIKYPLVELENNKFQVSVGLNLYAKEVITTTFGIKLTSSASDSTNYSVDGSTMEEVNARALADALATHLPSSPDGTSAAAANETATIREL